MAIGRGADEPAVLLATLPPTWPQRRLALAFGAALIVIFGIAAPIAAKPLPQLYAAVPIILSICFLGDLITAALLFSQFSIVRSRALLALASGYLFMALIVVPVALTYPGLFSPTGLLGAGLQTASWLYLVWHFTFPATVIAYACFEGRASTMDDVSTRSAIGWSAGIVFGLVCAVTLLFTAGNDLVPRVALDATRLAPLASHLATFLVLVCAVAFAFLWRRQHSVLDLWLLVALFSFLLETAMSGILNAARFSLGFYAGIVFLFFNATVVLVVLLAETTSLYARIARSHILLQRERENKLMNLEAMLSAISHEVRQPLTGISTTGGAALRFLERTPPDLERVRSCLNEMVTASQSAGEVFNHLSVLFRGASAGRETVDINQIVARALRALHAELEDHGVTALTELTSELPLVSGHGGQLQEVILNLAHNAIDAMDASNVETRVLRVATKNDGRDAITVVVEDTGPGIGAERIDSIFQPFVTTKAKGMGLGLAICRMIVERHGGQLAARSDKTRRGAVFQFTLPIKPAMPDASRI